MKKFRPSLTELESAELKRLASLDFSDYSEADVREEFLVELLKLLGYRKELDYSVSREESFKLNPLFLSVGSSRIKLDYLCSLRKQYFWIIDAKEAKAKDKHAPPVIKAEDIGQAHFYCLHPEINCRYFIVSNGWYTNLYDRDNIDDALTPVLSIRNTEITGRFLELDSYIGSTQILPALKEKMLDQVEKIFSAEIRVERLDEFIDAIKAKAAKARPKVEKAAREQYAKSQSPHPAFKLLEAEDLSMAVYSIFQSLRSKWEFEAVNKRLIERIKANHKEFSFKEYFFFSKLVLDRPYPVNPWYYAGVLYFLIQAHKEGLAIYYGVKTIKELLTAWLDLCLFHLSPKRIQRYLWICERLYAKIIKQSIIMLPVGRDNVKEILGKHLFFLPEEALASFGPNEVDIVISVVENSLVQFRADFINHYYNESAFEFKETLAHQYYLSLKEISATLDNIFGDSYQKMKQELGQDWQDLMGYDNLHNDRLGGAVCDILMMNEAVLELLSNEQKQRVRKLAEIGCTNFADEICMKLNISFNKPSALDKNRLAEWEKFYDPAADQRL